MKVAEAKTNDDLEKEIERLVAANDVLEDEKTAMRIEHACQVEKLKNELDRAESAIREVKRGLRFYK